MFLKIVQSKIINIYIITFVHYIQFNVKFNVKRFKKFKDNKFTYCDKSTYMWIFLFFLFR